MRPARLALLAALLVLSAPGAASADRLFASGGPTFKTVDSLSGPYWNFDYPVSFNGFVYFGADDGVHGNELWRTDGTAAGTTLVADTRPGADSGNPTGIQVVGNRLYWQGATSAGFTRVIHYVDASDPNTVHVAKMDNSTSAVPPGCDCAYGNIVGKASGKLMIIVLESGNSNYALFSLGDSGDTFARLPGTNSISAQNVFRGAASAGGYLYYTGVQVVDGANDFEVWRTDGTNAPTRVADVNPGKAGSNPGEWIGAGDRIYFYANDGMHGSELWTSDGTDTHMVIDQNPGSDGSAVANQAGLASNGTTLYYLPTDPTTGGELWKSVDGAPATVVKDLTPGSAGTTTGALVPFKAGVLYERGYSETYYSDGTEAGTTLLNGDSGFDSGFGGGPVVVGDHAYYRGGFAHFGGVVWRTDGTPGGTFALTAGGFDGAARILSHAYATTFGVLGSKALFFSRFPHGDDTAASDELQVYGLDTAQPDTTRQATTAPTITGTPTAGTILTGSKGTWTLEPNEYTYQWVVGGTPVPNANGETYKVDAADVGKEIRFRVTARGVGGPNVVSVDSAPAGATPGGGGGTTPGGGGGTTPGGGGGTTTPVLTVSRKAKLNGKAKVGRKLKLRLPKVSVSGAKISIRWYANGKRIKKQTKSKLKLKRKDKGKRITAKLTIKKAGYRTLVVKVGPTKKVR